MEDLYWDCKSDQFYNKDMNNSKFWYNIILKGNFRLLSSNSFVVF